MKTPIFFFFLLSQIRWRITNRFVPNHGVSFPTNRSIPIPRETARREKHKKRVTSCTHREEIWAHRGLSIGSLRSGWPATVLASRGKPVWTAADSSPVPVASEDMRVAWYPPA